MQILDSRQNEDSNGVPQRYQQNQGHQQQRQAQQNRPQQNQQAAMPNYNDFDDSIPF